MNLSNILEIFIISPINSENIKLCDNQISGFWNGLEKIEKSNFCSYKNFGGDEQVLSLRVFQSAFEEAEQDVLEAKNDLGNGWHFCT